MSEAFSHESPAMQRQARKFKRKPQVRPLRILGQQIRAVRVAVADLKKIETGNGRYENIEVDLSIFERNLDNAEKTGPAMDRILRTVMSPLSQSKDLELFQVLKQAVLDLASVLGHQTFAGSPPTGKDESAKIETVNPDKSFL